MVQTIEKILPFPSHFLLPNVTDFLYLTVLRPSGSPRNPPLPPAHLRQLQRHLSCNLTWAGLPGGISSLTSRRTSTAWLSRQPACSATSSVSYTGSIFGYFDIYFVQISPSCCYFICEVVIYLKCVTPVTQTFSLHVRCRLFFHIWSWNSTCNALVVELIFFGGWRAWGCVFVFWRTLCRNDFEMIVLKFENTWPHWVGA